MCKGPKMGENMNIQGHGRKAREAGAERVGVNVMTRGGYRDRRGRNTKGLDRNERSDGYPLMWLKFEVGLGMCGT